VDQCPEQSVYRSTSQRRWLVTMQGCADKQKSHITGTNKDNPRLFPPFRF